MNLMILMAIGVAATFVMILFMEILTKTKLANADMTRALGSIVTKNYEDAFLPGLAIKLAGGAFFGVIYGYILHFVAPVNTTSGLIIASTALGLFHGIALSVMLSVIVAEHHPLMEFRKKGPDVILGHLSGHIVFGFTLGVFFIMARGMFASFDLSTF